MSLELKQCEEQVLKLSIEDRAVLAKHLIASLDSVEDLKDERLWVEEAERRYQQYKDGNIAARSATEAVSAVRSTIK